MKILKESKLKVHRKKYILPKKNFAMIIMKENAFLPISIPGRILFHSVNGILWKFNGSKRSRSSKWKSGTKFIKSNINGFFFIYKKWPCFSLTITFIKGQFFLSNTIFTKIKLSTFKNLVSLKECLFFYIYKNNVKKIWLGNHIHPLSLKRGNCLNPLGKI